MIHIHRLKTSFLDAKHGLWYVFKHEQNFRVQCGIAVLVMVATFILSLRRSEVIVLLLLILFVLTLELVNSALEKFLDILKPRFHEQVSLVKDIAAAMVFVASLGSAIIGCMVFVPYLIALF